MTQEPQKSNTVLIVIAIIGVMGTIMAAAIGAFGSYNTEKLRQEAELTRIAFVSLTTQTAEARLTSPTYNQVATESITTYEPTLTTIPTRPSSTATPEVLSIIGTWKGTTTGHNESGPIAEVLTTVSISVDCQLGKDCGLISTEGRCDYQMTLTAIEDNVFTFDTIAISGTPSCYNYGNPEKTMARITLISDIEISFHFQSLDSSVERDGTLTKQ